MSIEAFSPGATLAVMSATTTSGTTSRTAFNQTGPRAIRVVNAGTGLVFIKWGISTVVAAVTDVPIPSGAVEVFSIGDLATHVAVITGTGTASVYVTEGQGQ